MFRDSKEYQDIAKIYADKVSKPENLEEMTGGLGIQGVQKMQNKNKPKSREEVGLKPKPPIGGGGRVSRSSQNMSGKPKPMPTTAEIRAKDKAAGGTGMSNIPSKEGNAVIGGKKLNPDFGKKVEIKKEPEISKFTKQGKPRTKAQMMAAKRIASGKSISDVKQSNQDAMRARAKAKFEAFKKRREEKKAGMSEGVKELTPYDIVLEYLLSSEQVATIEEANYVMTEMDGKTIKDIVEMQVNRADIIGGTKAAKDAAAGKGKGLYTPGKGVTKDFKLDPAFKLPKA